jgi:hypothetical protein
MQHILKAHTALVRVFHFDTSGIVTYCEIGTITYPRIFRCSSIYTGILQYLTLDTCVIQYIVTCQPVARQRVAE